jgi:DNA-binding NarL/FixJ family response regulator
MTDNSRLKVFIAEDHQLTRLGLRFALDQDQSFELIGEASDGESALEQVLALKPDIVLMDIELIGMNGIEATKRIKSQLPDVRVIILTTYDDDDKIFSTFSAGADGYCMKRVNTSQLTEAMKAVSEGRGWIDPAIADRVLARTEQIPECTMLDAPSQALLSPRELDVMRLVVEGLSNPEIAQRLFLSPETVKTHMRHIMEKLAVTDRTQAAVKAMKRGLI